MISDCCKVVIRIINKFILMGQRKTQKVGCAVISGNHSNMQCIPDDLSIFTAEAKAVDLALDFISTSDTNNIFFYIFSLAFCIESYEPYPFKESTDSETLRKMSRAFTLKRNCSLLDS